MTGSELSKRTVSQYNKGQIHLKSVLQKQRFQMGVFICLILIFLSIAFLYFLNIVQWGHGPDFGWTIIDQTIKLVVVETHGEAELAGLQKGDRIVSINDHRVATYRQLQSTLIREIPGENVYEVERLDQTIKIMVPNKTLGFGNAFLRFGLTWLLGIVFFGMGAVVFVMKPGTRPSWAFLLMMLNSSLYISFSFTSKLSPAWLGNVLMFASSFLPASIFHLTQTFPEEWSSRWKNTLFLWSSYVLSTGLFLIMWFSAPLFTDIPIFWKQVTVLYIAGSLLYFLANILFTYVKSSSMIAHARSKIILFGSVLAIGLPVIDVITTLFFNHKVLPHPILNLPFYIFFPLSIAYAIAKHNLFDVDVYIKRAVGYVLMTVTVAMTYFALQTLISTLVLKPLLGESADKVYPILFALLVVFLFNPLNRTVQGWVDKLFYRKKFDYKEAVTSVSNALASVLDLNEVINKLIYTVRKEMFIDTAGVILIEPKKKECQPFFVEDDPGNMKERPKDVSISYDDPLLNLLSKEKRLITRYDIEEDPRYSDFRESCGYSFSGMGASMALPLIYQDQMTGVLALGNKKSGHFYTREDIDLLQTLTSHGAIAIENARLFKDNLEKGRMEEELKIAHDIQVSMLPEKAPEIEGFEIAGMSIPAKEVGGDFYDYIEISSGEGGNRLAIVIGDVTGKGVSGALMMAASRSTFRVLAEQYSSVEELMGVGNRRLNKDIKKGMFVALLYAELNPREKTLTISNAGQTQPILCPADSSTQPYYIDTEGDKFPLGIIKDCTYQETEVRLKSGDVVVFYTDGVVEAMNDKGEMYGFERFMTSIEEGRGLGADAVMDKLVSDISSYVGGVEQHDDLTVVVVKME